MGLYRRDKFYWYSIMHNGKRFQGSTGTGNKQFAEKIYATVLLDIKEGRWFKNQVRKKTLNEMISRYDLEYTTEKDYYQKARDKSIFKPFLAYFGEDATLEQVSEMVGGYEHYRKTMSRKPATIMKELGLLRRMFNIARKQWKWKIENPVSEIELPKVRNQRVRYLSEQEQRRLTQALDSFGEQWLKPLVILALHTGLRMNNLCSLMWYEVHLSQRMIVIDAEKMKNDDYLGIPLNQTAFDTLRAQQKVHSLSGHVFHDSGEKLYCVKVQRAFRDVISKAGIVNFRFHDLRHTFASYLRQKGVDLHTISKLLGHKDLRMTKRYAHLNVDSLRSAVSKLNITILSRSEGETHAETV